MQHFLINCNAKCVNHNLQQYKKQFMAKADVHVSPVLHVSLRTKKKKTFTLNYVSSCDNDSKTNGKPKSALLIAN